MKREIDYEKEVSKMPYGLPTKYNTPKNNAWLERCVSGIKGTNKRTGKPYTDGDKIAICKAQLKKQGWKASEEAISEESLRDLEEKIRRALEPFKRDTVKETAPSSPNLWITDVFDDYVILAAGDDLFSVPWKELENGDVEFDFAVRVKVQKVVTYEPVVDNENNASAAKSNRREAFYGGKKVVIYD